MRCQALLSLASWIRSFSNCSGAAGGIFNGRDIAYSTATAQVGSSVVLLIAFVKFQEIIYRFVINPLLFDKSLTVFLCICSRPLHNQGGLQATSHGIRAWEKLLKDFILRYAIIDDLSKCIWQQKSLGTFTHSRMAHSMMPFYKRSKFPQFPIKKQ